MSSVTVFRIATAHMFLFAAAAASAQTTSTEARGTNKPVADPNRKFCRVTDRTGSIMPSGKTCHTKAEWAALEGRESQAASDLRDRNGRYGGSGVRQSD